jgi:aminoglycoside phosphotransferase family enzyme/predicted kinase
VRADAGGNAAPRPVDVEEAMCDSRLFPGCPPVSAVETHTARVFLAGDRAYKVKKPVTMDFLDFSTLERRHAVCREEVRVNEALAAGLESRLRALVPHRDGFALADADAPGAVEYVIEMRRFDDARTMAALVERGALDDEQVRAVGERLAGFHAGATVLAPSDFVGDERRACEDNMRELYAVCGDDDALARRVLGAERFAGAFLVARRAEIAARARAGHVRDGHGDLRAEHVLLEQPLQIVDRLEFDERLRAIDVADDLAFLVMDLERLGAGDAARLLVRSYRDVGGDPGSDGLLAFYAHYRALVRAKVALLRAAQLEGDAGGGARAAREEADGLLALAERFAWRARGRLVLAIGGPPASGKSTLAAALARRSGRPVLSSDALRKQLRGLEPSAPAPQDDYAPQARAAVYRALGEQAAGSAGAIVDATFGDPELRAAFLDGLGDARGRLLAIECHAPASVRARRARERRPDGAHGSDADAAVAARLGASFSGWDELPEEALLTLRTGVAPERLVDQLADWIDTGPRRLWRDVRG